MSRRRPGSSTTGHPAKSVKNVALTLILGAFVLLLVVAVYGFGNQLAPPGGLIAAPCGSGAQWENDPQHERGSEDAVGDLDVHARRSLPR